MSRDPRPVDTLDALARVIVPHAFAEGATSGAGLRELLDARLAAVPLHIRRDLKRGMAVLDSLPFRFFVAGTTSSWRRMPAAERADRFAKLAHSKTPLARTIHQAIRRLVLSTYYASPAALSELGVPAPLHSRKPLVDWEGPLAGDEEASAADVVARGTRDALPPRSSPPPKPLPRAVTPGSALRGHLELRADVVVIGTGAGGAVAASVLAEAGKDVVILEEGPFFTAHDFSENEGQMAPLLLADAGMRATTDLAFTLLQGGAVGGGTTVNWMLMLRPPAFVVDEWRREAGLDWARPEVLDPLLDEVEERTHTGSVPDDAHSPSNRALLDGARMLGWRVRPARINARGCVRAGTCTLGCRYEAKQDASQAWLPRAFLSGARLFSQARATRIEVVDRDNGRGLPRKKVHVTCADPGGGTPPATLAVESPVVVVAAGAVGTPALLQRSGLGGGVVGRFLRLHPTTAVMGEYDRDVSPAAGIPQSVVCDHFLEEPGGGGHGFWIECPALGPALGAAALPGFGDAHRAEMLRLRQTVPFIALVRDGADRGASNGRVRVNRGGVVRISYEMGEADRRTLSAAVSAAARLQFAAGARRVRTLHEHPAILDRPEHLTRIQAAAYGPNDLTLFSAHLNGTCRMGGNTNDTATNPEGERWGARGVYVCDGSLLPTAPGVNPQETIMAIALHLARGIAAR